MVAQTRTGGQSSPKKLKFHDKLVGKNPVAADALQKKLKALHSELAEMEQEFVDTHSLGSVRKELISTSILLHKDKGVKAYTACCLAELLRLYAPDAPYTQNELQDIFSFFFRQLSANLTGPDCPYYNEYFHLLESLSVVKSVVLVCDLPNADDLMVEIFKSFFAMVRHDLAKKIELFMADILIALIDEGQSLPSEVLETIMAQFMDRNTRMEQPAFRLAVQVCVSTADKLQRHVCQYFTDIIVTHSRDEDFDEIQKAHELIKRLNRSCPTLLHNVVPQLEEELRVQESPVRVMATQTLGEMFADKSGGDFIKKYPSTWTMWLARKNDQTTTVRLAFVEGAKGVLINSTLPELREQIEGALQIKLLDPDEKVRAAVCKLYSQLDYETALHHVSENMLNSVAGRGVDKKSSVQAEAMKAVARLFNLAYPEIESNEPAATQKFSWIPQQILRMASVSQEVKALAEQVIAEYILPLPSLAGAAGKGADIDETAWTDRLLCTMGLLDPVAINTLLGLSGIKANRPTIYERYLQSCIENNGGIIDDNEETVIAQLTANVKRVAAQFPDPQKAVEDLNTFAKLNESRLYKLLKTCMDPQTDLKNQIKTTSEFLRRLEQASSSIVPTMAAFLRRGTLHIVNQSSIPVLIKRMQKGADGTSTARSAQIWLSYISKHCPALYKLHVGELSKAIADEKNIALVEVCLQAYSAVAQWDEKLAPSDKRTLERLQRFVVDSNHRHAKFAARLLSYTKHRSEICAEMVETIVEELHNADPDRLVAHIAVLAQFALKAPRAFESKSSVIMPYLIKQVIMAPTPVDEEHMDTDEEWADDVDMTPELQAKVFALKTCRNRCIAQVQTSDSALDVAKPVLRMFTTLLQFSGSFSEDANDDPKTKARLRLQAAVSLLRLATVEKFVDTISVNFILLAITIQDPCYQVRMRFLNKLLALLTSPRLLPTFYVIPFLSVHDPEADVINTAKAFVLYALRSMPKKIRLDNFEMIFIRLLHLLAHHPDFAINEESIPDMAKYIDFYLDLVCTSENVALLYHLAMKAKTVRDSESHAYSENLYALSELAQHLIKARAKSHSWSIESYPGKVRLPGDILRSLPNAEAANEIVKTVFLPETVLSWLAEKQSKFVSEAKQKQDKPKTERKAPAKRKATSSKTNGHTKRPRIKAKRRKTDDSDEEESQSTESDLDEDEETPGDAKNPEPEVSGTETEGEEEAPAEERLGRGARTRAKARIKEQIRKPPKTRAKMPPSES